MVRRSSVLFVPLLTAGVIMQFKPPGEKERLAAIGPPDGLPETLRRALEPGVWCVMHSRALRFSGVIKGRRRMTFVKKDDLR